MTSKLGQVLGRVAATAVIYGAAAGLGALSAQAAEPIKIGFVTEMTGPWAFFGTSCVNGLKMGEKEVNDAGGALGRPLEFVVADNQTNPQQAVAASRSLDTQDKVVALSGPTSSDNALAIYGYAEQNKLPFLVPVAAFPSSPSPERVTPSASSRTPPAGAMRSPNTLSRQARRQDRADLFGLRADARDLRRPQIPGRAVEAPDRRRHRLPAGQHRRNRAGGPGRAASPDFVISVGGGGFDNTITNQLLDLGIKPDADHPPLRHNHADPGLGQAQRRLDLRLLLRSSLESVDARRPGLHQELQGQVRPAALLYRKLLLRDALYYQGGDRGGRFGGPREVPGRDVGAQDEGADLRHSHRLR